MEVKEERKQLEKENEKLENEMRRFLQEMEDWYIVSKRINSKVAFDPLLFILWRKNADSK